MKRSKIWWFSSRIGCKSLTMIRNVPRPEGINIPLYLTAHTDPEVPATIQSPVLRSGFLFGFGGWLSRLLFHANVRVFCPTPKREEIPTLRTVPRVRSWCSWGSCHSAVLYATSSRTFSLKIGLLKKSMILVVLSETLCDCFHPSSFSLCDVWSWLRRLLFSHVQSRLL